MNADIRQLFPVTKNYTYLNHAAVAPISLPVYEAMQRYTRDLLECGLVHWNEWGKEVDNVRGLAAQLLHAQPYEIAFAANTSTGLSFLANGLDWRAGENIVTADCEFPSNQQPWQRLQKAYGVEIRQAKERDGRLETDEILGLIDARTRVVTLSFVEFASGFRNDLETIGKYCRARDVLFVVDAIQGLGALQLDVERCCIDALSADAHKFLLGPDGVALFYLSARVLERIQPTVVGWTSVKHPFEFSREQQDWAEGARRFEPGALNTAGIVGMGAAAHTPHNLLKRDQYASSAAIDVTLEQTLKRNNLTVADLTDVELYSCFPCIPKMARRVIDWPVDRPVTAFGGLTFGWLGGHVGGHVGIGMWIGGAPG